MKTRVLLAIFLASLSSAYGQNSAVQAVNIVKNLQTFSNSNNKLCQSIKFANPVLIIVSGYILPLPAYFSWVKMNAVFGDYGYISERNNSIGQGYYQTFYSNSNTTNSFTFNIYMSEVDRYNTEVCVTLIP
jgi:hypothetical protein